MKQPKEMTVPTKDAHYSISEMLKEKGYTREWKGRREEWSKGDEVIIIRPTYPQKKRYDIYEVYANHHDMTFIMRDEIYEIYTEEIEVASTECVGWYYGEPSKEATAQFTGKLKADYTL